MLAPLLGVIAAGLGVSLVAAGGFVAVFEAAGLTAPAAGWLVDHIGARRALGGSLVAFAVAASVVASAPNWFVFAGALLALGLGVNVYEAGAVVWLANASSFRERAAWMGRFELSWAGGLLIGVPIAGVLSVASWRLAYGALAFVAVAARVLVVPRLGAGGEPRAHHLDRATDDLPELSRDHTGSLRATAVFVSFGVLCGASQMVFVVYGVWLEDRFGFGTAAIGAVAFALGAGDLVANFANARYTDRIGKSRSASLGAMVVVVSALGLATGADRLVVGVALLAVLIVGFEFALLSSKPLLTELGWRRRGVGVGIGFAGASVSRGVAAVVATTLYSDHGFAAAAIASAACATCAALLFRFAVIEPSFETSA